MAIIAAEACTMQVSTMPITVNSSTDMKPWSEMLPNAARKFGYSSRLGTDDCRYSIPSSSSAKPMVNSPMYLSLSLLANMKKIAIASRKSGRLKFPPDSPRAKILSIQVISVLPILAPIMTEMAPARDIIPALTKLTTITVEADDD